MEQFGAGSGTEGVEAGSELLLDLQVHGSEVRPRVRRDRRAHRTWHGG
jgi:hypothetical protein